jgi:hypothetical protein
VVLRMLFDVVAQVEEPAAQASWTIAISFVVEM